MTRDRWFGVQAQDDCRRLKDLERLRDNLVHMVVHDMRSPLLCISGNLEILESGLGNALLPSDRSCLEDAQTAAKTLVDMVSSLLDVSRMESGQMPLRLEACELGAVARDTVGSLSALLRQTPVRITVPPEGAVVMCDRKVVQRVIDNLLGNAIKFSPEGSEVQLTVRRVADGMRVAVSDQGPGIPAEYHARIFDKFGQAELGLKFKGLSSGLGLTFCKLAVERHGGRIGIDSEPGHGSTFWFVLPLGQP